jgi:hypothetical protein
VSSLAEIVEEGKSAEETYRNARAWTAAEIGAADACHRFYLNHGPRLLAVCEAAVEIAPQIDGFCCEAETGVRPPGGQQAGMDRSWASRVPPSVIGELRWYSRAFREFLAAFDSAAGGQP